MCGRSASATPTPAHVEALVQAVLHIYRPLLIDVAHALQRSTSIEDVDSGAVLTFDGAIEQALSDRVSATTSATAASPSADTTIGVAEENGARRGDAMRGADETRRKRPRSATSASALEHRIKVDTAKGPAQTPPAASALPSDSRDSPPPLRRRSLQLRLNGALPTPTAAAASLASSRPPPLPPLCFSIANDALNAGVAVLAEAVLTTGACAAWLSAASRECTGDATSTELHSVPSTPPATAWVLTDVLLRLDTHVAVRATPPQPSRLVLRWCDYAADSHRDALDNSASRSCEEVRGGGAAASTCAGPTTAWSSLPTAVQDAVFASVASAVVRATAIHAAQLLDPLCDVTAELPPRAADGAAAKARAGEGLTRAEAVAAVPAPPPLLVNHIDRTSSTTAQAAKTFDEVQEALKARQRRERARPPAAPRQSPVSAPPPRAAVAVFPSSPSPATAAAGAAEPGRDVPKRSTTPHKKHTTGVEPAWVPLARHAEAQDHSCFLVCVHAAGAGGDATVHVQPLSSPFGTDFTTTRPSTAGCPSADMRDLLHDPRHQLVWRWFVGLQHLAAATSAGTALDTSRCSTGSEGDDDAEPWRGAALHADGVHDTAARRYSGADGPSVVEVPSLQTYATEAAQLFTLLHRGAATCHWELARAYAVETGKLMSGTALAPPAAAVEATTDATANLSAPLDGCGSAGTASLSRTLATSARCFSLRTMQWWARDQDAMSATAAAAHAPLPPQPACSPPGEVGAPPTPSDSVPPPLVSPPRPVVWLPLVSATVDGGVADTAGEAEVTCSTAAVFHDLLDRASNPQCPVRSVETAEALGEVGAVLAAMSDVCAARTLLDVSAWRYGRNRMQVAAASLVHASADGSATADETATQSCGASLHASRVTSTAPRLLGVFHHESGVLHVADGTTFALEAE